MYVRPCESNKRLDERTTDGKKRNVHSNGKALVHRGNDNEPL